MRIRRLTVKVMRFCVLVILSMNVGACSTAVAVKNTNSPILRTDLMLEPVVLQEEIVTPTTAIKLEEDIATPTTTQVIDSFEQPPIQLLAAYLAEIGYFQGDIRQAGTEAVESALKLFQADLKLSQTGKLDESLWKKLQSIELSNDIKSQLIEKQERINVNFKENAHVFAVEKVKCKSSTEAWILFYEGFIQKIQSDSLAIKLTKRYGLWYDTRYQGVSDENWWCIPSKRFCYSPIEFSDWGGTLKAGDIENFDKIFSIPYELNITSLAPNLFKKICQNTD